MIAAARQSFKEQEALVYQQLAQLIRDAVWLKSYIAAVMRLEQEAFQSAYASLGPSKATLPLQQEVPMQSEQMMMTSGSTASRPVELQPQVCYAGDYGLCTGELPAIANLELFQAVDIAYIDGTCVSMTHVCNCRQLLPGV